MRILHLEDSSADTEFIHDLVVRGWTNCEIVLAGRRADYVKQVSAAVFDLIISDYTIPGFSGLDALKLAQDYQPDTPFIFCSGTIGEDRAIEAIRAGATDYVLKDNLNRLIPAIRRALQEKVEQRKRREAETALRHSERRYRSLINATSEIVWTADPSGMKVQSEPAWDEFTGSDPQRNQNNGWIDTIHPDDRTAVAKAWTEALTTRNPYTIDFRVKRADGEWRFMSVRGVPQFRDDGQLEEWTGVCVDITARKVAEESERRLIVLLESTTDFVVVAGSEGEVLYANPASRRVVGMDPIGDKIYLQQFYSPRFRKQFIDEAVKVAEREGSWSGESVLKTAGGEIIPISQVLVAHKSGEGVVSHFSTIMRDITASKEAQRKLREQAEVITQARNAVIITDLDSRISFWNQGAERLYGWHSDEVLGRRAEDLFDPQVLAQLSAPRTKTLATGAWTGELKVHNRDRKPLIVEVRVTLIRDENGEPKSRLNIATDVTEKKKLEEQFLRAQRMENLGLLASGISHDLNNILTPILMAAPLLQTRLSDEDDIRLIQTLDQSAQRGAEMVRQILSFARGAGGDFRLIQVRHLLRDAIRISESTFPKAIAIRHVISAELSVIEANPTQIHQLLLNLCVNARDAMPDGGTLSIRAENCCLTEATTFTSGRAPVGDYVMIEVRDTGTGIPPDVFARMWEPFFTTKGGRGTGLGLSTVRGIVEEHHGFIDVQTEQSRGSVFQVYLPAVPEGEAKASTATPFVEIEGRNETILVLDDEASLRAMIGASLTEMGYQPIVVRSAAEAISQAEEHRDRIQLLITDVSMPDMNGRMLAQRILELIPTIRIIATSGHGDTERFGDYFLAKPFNPTKLIQAVHQVLHGE